MAKRTGCDYVKFQKRDIETVYTKEFLSEKRESPWGKTQRDQKEGLEFNREEYDAIDDYCKKINIKWPNDLLFNNQKFCGILQEVIHLNKKDFLQNTISIIFSIT